MNIVPSFLIPLDDLEKLFPLKPQSCVRLSGIQDGIIIKFKTFYLKIYTSNDDMNYIIHGRRYNIDREIFEIIVPWNKIKDFAKRITMDNYLQEFIPPKYT